MRADYRRLPQNDGPSAEYPVTTPQFNTWQSVHDEVLRRIHAREWPPGGAIPHEADLAVTFGCARATVNRALRALATAGILDRRRRVGTRVALHPVRKATLSIPLISAEVAARGQHHSYCLLSQSMDRPPIAIQSLLGTGTRPLLHLIALHRADEAPYVFEDRWVNTDVVPDLLTVDLTRETANAWLVANAPFTRGDIAFSAQGATETDVQALGCALGTALFIVDRTTWNGPAPITAVRLAYAPGYRMATAL